jgi:signal transduction histidine kinase/streptogramin lyase
MDNDGGILVGTNGGGTCKLDPQTGKFSYLPRAEGVIRDILVDSRGDYWVGSYGGGLKKLMVEENKLWNFYDGDNGLQSNIVLTIHEDKKKRFWIGTKEGGLHLFDRDSLEFRHFDVSYGLPSNEVKGILEDDHGNLWLSTPNGITRFNTETFEVDIYKRKDGLQDDEFNTLAYYKDTEGYMYFGGINGFNRFHPDSIINLNNSFPIVLTDLKIFNESVKPGDNSVLEKHISQTHEIEIPYEFSVLTFEYAALNFNVIKETDYAYKLEGFDESWNYVNQLRSATYTNLSPGEYEFKVRVAYGDSLYAESERKLSVIIVPPFWMTNWFYLLVTVCMILTIYGVFQWRMRFIKKQNHELETEVRQRTSELREKNEDLEKVLSDLKKTKMELVESAHKAGMADIASGVLHNVGNILNSVNTSSSMIEDKLKASKISMLRKANSLLVEHVDDLEGFIISDPKGKQLMQYYLKLEGPIVTENEYLREHAQRLSEKIKIINEVISAQQSYSRSPQHGEEVNLRELINETLTLFSGSIDKHGIHIDIESEEVRTVFAQKTKLIHVLVNLIKNSKYSLKKSETLHPRIELRLYEKDNAVCLDFSDNGMGIEKEHLSKIFNQGFSTKDDGNGFGLHSSANYMKEMDGAISVKSEGPGFGVTFTLILKPYHP